MHANMKRVNHCTGTVLGAEAPDREHRSPCQCSPLHPHLLTACWFDRGILADHLELSRAMICFRAQCF